MLFMRISYFIYVFMRISYFIYVFMKTKKNDGQKEYSL